MWSIFFFAIVAVFLATGSYAALVRDRLGEALFSCGAIVILTMLLLIGFGEGQHIIALSVSLSMLGVAVFLVFDSLIVNRHRKS